MFISQCDAVLGSWLLIGGLKCFLLGNKFTSYYAVGQQIKIFATKTKKLYYKKLY